MVRQCESAHCSGADMEINEICKLEGWPINHPVLTRDNIGPCYCSCSCLAFGTMVEDGTGGFKAIENYAVGDEIMASGTGLSWTSKPVVFSGGTTGASRQKFTVLVLYGETALAVTSDHLFLLAGDEHTLKRADRLSPDDVLISPSGEPVSVTAVHIGDYLAGFHHVAASDKEAPPEDLEGHLLNTNGVVSADYVVQITARRTDVAGFKVKQHDDMPVVGSAEYVERYGRGCLEAPELPDAVTSRTPLRASGFNAPDLDLAQYTFVPADATRVIVPDHACGFLSPEEAEAKARSPKRPFNDPLAREWTEALIQQHKTFYPDVTYSLDWASDEVNAYAWVENNVRHVALKGAWCATRTWSWRESPWCWRTSWPTTTAALPPSRAGCPARARPTTAACATSCARCGSATPTSRRRTRPSPRWPTSSACPTTRTHPPAAPGADTRRVPAGWRPTTRR